MEIELEKQIIDVLEQTKEKIRANMSAERINASGRTSASLHVEVRDGGSSFALVGGGSGAAPIQTLEFGRGSGKVPVGFYDMIKQWTRDKGLTFPSERERNTFSYFVARKIAREGTQRHTDPSTRKDVYSTAAAEATEQLREIVNNYTAVTIFGAFEKSKATVAGLRGAFT